MTIVLIWILNLVLVPLNALGVGAVWAKAKATGGWTRFSAWMTAIQATSFASLGCFLLIMGGLRFFLSEPLIKGTVELALLGWVLIAHPFLLLSGLMMTVDSYLGAIKDRRILSWSVAGFNSLATASNIYRAIHLYLEITKGTALSSSGLSAANRLVTSAIALGTLLFAIGVGITITAVLIRRARLKQARYERLEAEHDALLWSEAS